jgi:hypothetical protein
MRLRLLRRRLTISAPRMAVRSAMPWPLRWIAIALVFGFCAALALWAFEFGKSIAGLDGGTQEDLQRLRSELRQTQLERDAARRVADTVETRVTAEKAAQEQLLARIHQMEIDNLALRDDLGFFEQLIPASGAEALSVRALQAERVSEGLLRWRVLLMQPQKNAPEFNGTLQLSFIGTRNGKPWSMELSQRGQDVRFRQLGRFQGRCGPATGCHRQAGVCQGVARWRREGDAER